MGQVRYGDVSWERMVRAVEKVKDRMKLTSFRDKDRTHIRDLLEVGLIDGSWCARLPKVLQARLQEIIDTPHG